MRHSALSIVAAVVLLLGPALSPAHAQTPTLATGPVIDIIGQWSGTTGTIEEQPLRGDPGVEVGEFVGMPINDAARLHGNSWNPDWGSLPE